MLAVIMNCLKFENILVNEVLFLKIKVVQRLPSKIMIHIIKDTLRYFKKNKSFKNQLKISNNFKN